MELPQIKKQLRKGDLKLIHEILLKKGESISYTYVRCMFCDENAKSNRTLREDVKKIAEEIIESRDRLINNPNE